MENYDKIMKLYESGRYQCDQFFYQELIRISQHLDLFEVLPKIQHNLEIVKKVAELTQKHLEILEKEDDEEAALKVIHEINSEVKTIDTELTIHTIEEIKKMQGKSFKEIIVHRIKQQPYKKMYLQVCQRILNSVHDPKLILQDFTIASMFMMKNHEKITQFVDIYNNVLTHGIEELKKFRQNVEFINKNEEIRDHVKVKNYLLGSYIIYTTLVKINEVYKVISGDNKFGLKLGALKKQIQHENKDKNLPSISPINCVEYRQSLILPDHQVPTLCSICLRASNDHPECLSIIKMFYRPTQ